MKLDDKGSALVEAALVLPILFLIVFGICEFGYAMYVNNTLTNAAREGARLAAVSARPITANDTRVEARVKECLTFGYAAGDLGITTLPPAAAGDPVKVTVTLKYHSFTQFIPLLDNKTFKGEATMRYEL